MSECFTSERFTSEKTQALDDLHARMHQSLDAHVQFGNLVFGAGNANARLVFVGEAPGRFEAERGVPFVGAAGKNLDMLLSQGGLARQDVYITNAVPYRPVRAGARKDSFANRPPAQRELSLCRPFLLEELCIVRPAIVATLGNSSLRALLQKDAPPIGDVHGTRIAHDAFPFPLFALYHPASAIYDRTLWDVLARDMCSLGELLRTM